MLSGGLLPEPLSRLGLLTTPRQDPLLLEPELGYGSWQDSVYLQGLSSSVCCWPSVLGHVHVTVPWLNIGARPPVRGSETEHGSELTRGWALSFYNQILEGALGHGAMFCGMEVNH